VEVVSEYGRGRFARSSVLTWNWSGRRGGFVEGTASWIGYHFDSDIAALPAHPGWFGLDGAASYWAHEIFRLSRGFVVADIPAAAADLGSGS